MSEFDASHNGASILADSRQKMLDLLRRWIRDERVVDAMAAVPREQFVVAHLALHAYGDRALPIGHGQTISQPLIVAMMLEALQSSPGDRVLEVGTGSGYAAAVVAQLAGDVITVERIPELVARARRTLNELGIRNVRVIQAGDGLGRKEDAPYDAVLVSAGAPHVPRALLDQVEEGGRLIVPIGSLRNQELVRATKTPHGVDLARLGPCAFVPLIGDDAWRDEDNDVSRRSIVR